FVVEEFEDDRPPVDGRVGNGDELLVVVKQRSTPDRLGAARGQDVAEDQPADQIVGRSAGAAGEADRLDRGGLRDNAALLACERLAQTVEFGAEVMHLAVAFGTKVAAIIGGRELRRHADITAAEVMQQSLAHEMRASAGGADLAHVQMMAVAFGTEADSV